MIPPARVAVARLRLFDDGFEVDEHATHLTLLDFRTDESAEATCHRLDEHMLCHVRRIAPHRRMPLWRLDAHDYFNGDLLFSWSYSGEDR